MKVQGNIGNDDDRKNLLDALDKGANEAVEDYDLTGGEFYMDDNGVLHLSSPVFASFEAFLKSKGRLNYIGQEVSE